MAMNNPFLQAGKKKSNSTATLGSETRRLLGGFRAPFTLVLVIGPLLLALAGGLDWVMSWFYSFTHKIPADKRIGVFFGDCLTHNPAVQGICDTVSKSTTYRLRLWPFAPRPGSAKDDDLWGLMRLLGQPEAWWYGGLLGLAVMAFISIGNPNFANLGDTLKDALGLAGAGAKGKAGLAKNGRGKAQAHGGNGKSKKAELLDRLADTFSHELLPSPSLVEGETAPDHNWIIGGTLLREWNSDPGFFSTQPLSLKGKSRGRAGQRDGLAALTSPTPTGPQSKEVLRQRPPYFLTADILRTNLMIVAPQGSGKTTSVFRPTISFIRRGGGAAVVWDSKGDDFRYQDFTYNFDLEDFEHSFRLIVFSGKTPEQAGERLGEALIPELSEDKRYFSDIAKDALAAIAAGHYACTGGLYPELNKILLYINKDSEELGLLIEQVDERVFDLDEAARLKALLRSVQTLTEIKGDLLGNLRTALAPLTTPEVSRFLAANPDPEGVKAAHPAYSIEELLAGPGLIRLGLNVADRPRVAPIIGRLVMAQFVFSVLSPRTNRDILKLAVVDEAHNFVSLPICKGMAQARSNNAGFMLAFQTLSQIHNDSMLETIFSLAGTKLVMAGVGDKDADRFSRLLGKVWLEFVTHGATSGRSTNRNSGGSRSGGSFIEFGSQAESGSKSSHSTTYGRGSSTNRGETTSSHLQQRELFNSYEIRSLPQYHAIIESADTYGQRWQAQIIDMSRPTVQTLEGVFIGLTRDKDKDKDQGKKEKALADLAAPQLTLPAPVTQAQEPEPKPEPEQSTQTQAEAEAEPEATTTTPVRPVQQTTSAKPFRLSFSVSVSGNGAEGKVAGSSSTTKIGSGQPPSLATLLVVPTQQPLTDILEPNLPPATSRKGEATSQTEGGFGATEEVPGMVRVEIVAPVEDEAEFLPFGSALSGSLAPALASESFEDEDEDENEQSMGELENHLEDSDDENQSQAEGEEQESALTSPSTPAPAPGSNLVPTMLGTIQQALKAYGIEPLSTGWLAQTVLANGRDLSYVRHLAAKPDTTNLPGYLNWAITANFNPTWPLPSATAAIGSSSLLDQHRDMLAAGTAQEQTNQALSPEELHRQEQFERIKQALLNSGVASREADRLTGLALTNGRDYEYIRALVNKPNTKNVAAWLNFAISQNVPPPSAASSGSSKAKR